MPVFAHISGPSACHLDGDAVLARLRLVKNYKKFIPKK